MTDYITGHDMAINILNTRSIREMLNEVRAASGPRSRKRITDMSNPLYFTQFMEEVRANHNGQSRFHKTMSRVQEYLLALLPGI